MMSENAFLFPLKKKKHTCDFKCHLMKDSFCITIFHICTIYFAGNPHVYTVSKILSW